MDFLNSSSNILQGYIPLIVELFVAAGALVTGGMVYANLRNKIEDNAKDTAVLQARMEAISPILLQIQLDLAEIKTIIKIKFKEHE